MCNYFILFKMIFLDQARNTFKKHVNTLASINNINNEKWLILKRKYMQNKDDATVAPVARPDIETTNIVSPKKSEEKEFASPEPPQYRMPPPVIKQAQESPFSPENDKRHYSPRNSFDSTPDRNVSDEKTAVDIPTEDIPPKLYPRRKSNNLNETVTNSHAPSTINENNVPVDNTLDTNKALKQSHSSNSLSEADQTVSVKERKQMFNKMASDVDVLRPRHFGNRSSVHVGLSDDRFSLFCFSFHN